MNRIYALLYSMLYTYYILLLRDIIYVRSREIIPLIIFNNDIKTHDGL